MTELYRSPAASVSERVADLLSRMTLEEKVAQLGAVWITAIVGNDRFDESVAGDLLADGIGQVTRIGSSTGLWPDESARLLNAIQEFVVQRTRLGIPLVLHEESVAGFTHRGATVFPQALGLAATWDPALVGEVAGVIRAQMLGTGARMALAPVLDVARDPRWGRVEETYGESPELCSRMGVAYVGELQGRDLNEGVVCAAKHFLAYAVPSGGRNQAPVHLGPRELRDVYAAPFAAAISEAGLAGIMNSYSSVDGLPCAGDPAILTGLLRDELGFDGVVVADYFAVQQLWENHRTASDAAEAARLALSAGLDVELPALDCYRHLPELVRSGRLSASVVDTAVERVLAQKFRLGLFERPFVDPPVRASYDAPDHRALARRAAGRAVCLLVNDGVLPLDRGALSRVAVLGPHAHDVRLLQGDYHYPAHLEIIYGADGAAGDGTDRSGLPAEGGSFQPGPHFTPHVTPLDGLRSALGPAVEVEYVRGCHYSDVDDADLPAAVDAARRADVAVVCVGGHSGLLPHSTVGEMRDSATLELTGAQVDLVEAVGATGTPTVVVVMSGRVHVLGRVAASANALLWTAPPGEEGGSGLADVLTGAVPPSGRLPVTLPRTVGQLPVHHDQRSRGDRSEIWVDYTDSPVTPLFAFGHGLSYTTFVYGRLDVGVGSTTAPTTVSFDVTNVGDRSGEEVVQLYVRDEVASVTRPLRELIGFTRVALDPGSTARVAFTVDPSRLAFHDASLTCVTEPGAFTFLAGAASDDIRAQSTVHLDGEVTEYPLRRRVPTAATVSLVGGVP
jgi:beta-glucosidase